MTSRRDKHKQAYQFIYEKLHESDLSLSYNTVKSLDATSVTSLGKIDKLKNGYTDPSEELAAALKTLLKHVTSEGEIEEFPVKPFLSESRSSK